MLFPDKAAAFRSFISHSSSTSRVAASIVISAALIVAIGAAERPREATSPVDIEDIQKMSARQGSSNPSRLVFLETDPARYSAPSASETAVYLPPPGSPDMEANMGSGHIQTF
jgi:hypothetical protein